MVIFPVILVGFVQLAFNSQHVPIPLEARAQHEAILELRIRRLDVGDQNGWTFLSKAMAEKPRISQEATNAFKASFSGKTYEKRDLESLAAEAEGCRALVREALSKPYWQTPWDQEDRGSEDELPRSTTMAIRAVRPLVAHLILGISEGKAGDLVTDLGLMLKLAETSIKYSISLEEWLVGCSIHHLSNRIVIQYLAGKQVEPATIKALEDLMEDHPLAESRVQESLRHFFADELALLLQMGSSAAEFHRMTGEDKPVTRLGLLWKEILLWWTFSPAETAAYFNSFAAEIVGRCDEPIEAAGHPAFAGIRDFKRAEGALEILQMNAIGRNWATSMRSYERILGNAAALRTAREATLAAINLKLWELDHEGQLPRSLDELVPEYLRRLPVDLVNQKPLRYDREKRLLYSIGIDMIETPLVIPEAPSIHAEKGEMVLRFP